MSASLKLEAAQRIVTTLREAGHEAYFAGGCVRDLLLGRVPEDFDVATSATPDVVLQMFPRTFAVGAHFGVVLVSGEDGQLSSAAQSVACPTAGGNRGGDLSVGWRLFRRAASRRGEVHVERG